jgi:hypothetical protein
LRRIVVDEIEKLDPREELGEFYKYLKNSGRFEEVLKDVCD